MKYLTENLLTFSSKLLQQKISVRTIVYLMKGTEPTLPIFCLMFVTLQLSTG